MSTPYLDNTANFDSAPALAAQAEIQVTSLTLINTSTNQPVAGFNPIPAGATINLASIGTQNISIRANTSPASVGSVKFGLDGNSNHRVENGSPYALFGDNAGVYVKWASPVGAHTVTATPYVSSGGGGDVGTALSISFTVVSGIVLPAVTVSATSGTANETTGAKGVFTITRAGSTASSLVVNYTVSGTAVNGTDYSTITNSVTIPAGSASAVVNVNPVNDGVAESTETVILTLAGSSNYSVGSPSNATVNIIDGTVVGQVVSSFTLINTDTNQPVSGYASIANGATIDLAAIGTQNISIRANTSPATVGSVRFGLDGNANFRVESGAPYALFGDNAGVYIPWSSPLGSHTVTGTPFTASGATGTAGTPLTISFTIVNNTASPWTSGANMPLSLGEVAGGLINGKMYIVGEGSSATLAYDISSNTWVSNLATRPFVGNHHGAEVINGKLYLFGGLGGGSDGTVQIYDPVANAWTTGAAMPFAAGSVATALINGIVYAAGGIIGSATTNLAAKYDPGTNTWTNIAPMVVGRNHTASATDGSRLYVFGGRDGGNTVSNGFDTVQIYTPATNTWVSSSTPGSTIAPLPQARGGTGKAVFYNGEFYVIGGETSTGAGATAQNVYNRVDIYNPTTNAWRLGSPMPTARHGIFPLLSAGRIYVAGGGIQAGNSSSNILQILDLT